MRADGLIVLAVLTAAMSACGGDAPPAKVPDEPGVPPMTTATVTATPTDTVATPAPTETPPEPPPPPPAPEPPPIQVTAVKFSPKGGKLKAMELRSDGSVVQGNKVVGTITPDSVRDVDGKTLLTVSNDGTIAGDALARPVRFQGDDLVGDDGFKVTVADDGTVSMTQPNGKPTIVGKVDNVAGSKRAAALLAAWSTLLKTPKAIPPAGHQKN